MDYPDFLRLVNQAMHGVVVVVVPKLRDKPRLYDLHQYQKMYYVIRPTKITRLKLRETQSSL